MRDFRDIYKERLAPLVNEIETECMLNHIPFFLTICTYDDEKKTVYERAAFGARSNGIRLADDQILHHLKIANGFETIPKRTRFEDLLEGLFADDEESDLSFDADTENIRNLSKE